MVPTPSDLRVFSEVSSASNLSRAAVRLGLTQPAVTQAIQRLETAVGAQLLIRGKRGVTLTAAGRILQSHAQHLQTSWDSVRFLAQDSATAISGRVTLGCHTAVAAYALPRPLKAAYERHPRLEVQLKHDLSRRITQSVLNREIDLGVVVNPTRHGDLVITPLCKDVVTFWRAADFPAGPPPATLPWIGDQELLQTQALLKRDRKLKGPERRFISTSSLEVAATLTAQGVGIGILPAKIAAAYGRGMLKRIAGAPTYDDEVAVIYRSESRSNPNVLALARLIADRKLAAPSEA